MMQTGGMRIFRLSLAAALLAGGVAGAADIPVTIYADAGYPPYSYDKDGQAAGLYHNHCPECPENHACRPENSSTRPKRRWPENTCAS